MVRMARGTKVRKQITVEIGVDSLECVEALVDRQSFSQCHGTCLARRYTLETAHTQAAHIHIHIVFQEDRKCRPLLERDLFFRLSARPHAALLAAVCMRVFFFFFT